MKTKLFLLVFAILSLNLNGQTKKNIELIFELVDKSLTEIKEGQSGSVALKFNAVDNLDIIKGRVAYNLKGFSEGDKLLELSYTVDSLKVNYPEMFRDGFFGDYKMVRNINYSGYFSLTEKDILIKNSSFRYSAKDTVNLEEINNLETQAVDFTRGEKPSEPLIDSVIETVLAVGAAAVSVILFFIVRSE